MKTLLLIRHAQSSWDLPMEDRFRPLTNKGRKAAKAMAEASLQFLPDNYKIFSSPSKRTTETAHIFSETAGYPEASIDYIDELYTFDGNQLEKTIRRLPNQFSSSIIFGHNDAITNIVNKFGDQYIDTIPTAGLVILRFEQTDWQEIKKGTILKLII